MGCIGVRMVKDQGSKDGRKYGVKSLLGLISIVEGGIDIMGEYEVKGVYNIKYFCFEICQGEGWDYKRFQIYLIL